MKTMASTITEQKHPNCTQLTLHSILQVSRTLENIVSSAFGPDSSRTMLTTATGQVMITSNGMSILSSLHLSHPVANLIIDALHKMYNYTGDGSKTFVVYVNAILQEIEDFLGKSRGRVIHPSKTDITRVRILLQNAHQSLLQHLYSEAQNFCDSIIGDADKQEGFDESRLHSGPEKVPASSAVYDLRSYGIYQATRFLRTGLGPHYSLNTSLHLAETLTDFITTAHTCQSTNHGRVRFIIDNFEFCFVKVPQFPYEQSRNISGILLDREFVSYSRIIDDHPKLIILRCSMDVNSGTSEKEAVAIKTLSQVMHLAESKNVATETFLKRCHGAGVRLIISSENVPEFALQFCRDLSISVVSCVSEEDLNRLEFLLERMAITCFYDEVTERNMIELKSFQPLTIGMKKFSHLLVPSHHQARQSFRHFVLCAPTDGLLHGMQANVLNCLKALYLTMKCYSRREGKELVDATASVPHVTSDKHNCEEAHQDSFRETIHTPLNECIRTERGPEVHCRFDVIPGGGVFEFFVFSILQDMTPTSVNGKFNDIYEVIGRAVLHVPQLLHKNLAVSKRTLHRDFLYLKAEMISSVVNKKLCFINRKGGPDRTNDIPLESLEIKTHILLCALQTVIQIMRIDSLVGAITKSH